MSPAQAVREVLVADLAVQAIVAARVFPVRIPPRAEFPAVVVTVISQELESTFDVDDATTLSSTRVQVDCYAKQYDEAHALAELVQDVLSAQAEPDGIRVVKLDDRDLFEDETLLHRVSTDFSVWFGR